jgi:hemolysin III
MLPLAVRTPSPLPTDLQADGCPPGLVWKYDRAELLADGLVHAIGLGLALFGAMVLIFLSCHVAHGLKTSSIVTYSAGLLSMLGCSAAYNLWPVSPRKWLLRRLDHSAIFLFIAATYTPLIAHLEPDRTTYALLVGVWAAAAMGVLLKVKFPGRFDRLSIGLCLILGCSGLLIYEPAVASLPSSTLVLIVIGGAFYMVGLIFHLWEDLRFQNSIWHGFVLIAAACHYAAILNCLPIVGS